MGITVCSKGFFNNTHTDGGIRSVICNDNKSSSDLILEYPDPDSDPDVCEDVFVSDIQSESIADRDGRLKRGDQILRVNGIDIKNKNHAESQIGNNKMAVTLLVSRILYPVSERTSKQLLRLLYYVRSSLFDMFFSLLFLSMSEYAIYPIL